MELKSFATKSLKELGVSEAQVESMIAANPGVLGLGKDLELVGRQLRQPRAGILDLLLQDPDRTTRWEVEIQLGKLDESHIIRAIEYWDKERSHYPDFKHIAVIVAEEITGRFMNVISLFHGAIPLVAIQMQALEANGSHGLHFTKVLEPIERALEDEEPSAPVDRATWESRASRVTVGIVDQLIALANNAGIPVMPKFNAHYIGTMIDGRAQNFMVFRPRKSVTRFELRLPDSSATQAKLEAAGITLIDYEPRFGGYVRMSLRPDEVKKNEVLLLSLIKDAHVAFGGEE